MFKLCWSQGYDYSENAHETLRLWGNEERQALVSSGVVSNSCWHTGCGTKFTQIAYQQESLMFEPVHPTCAILWVYLRACVCKKRTWAKCKLCLWHCNWHQDLSLPEVTLVSATACSSFFNLSWEDELAEALSSWVLILLRSSSSFSRSCSKVWAQLSHSGI